ncbi:hypothetical protein HYH03_002196 [Edaphochlamys debaryana]|uniref:S-acyltransferase n=1 Tax=Edaphochlamys debaryana TaxID=47281 RepID=A0A835YC16_9CHLO|nr:hypothetical protein HYH03_002196 [Edaphochlamys debaryana]|eukprot:KAG2499908.1 hypothetical protein HYH03_002196 [Edaphochlamys debaryana]
MIEIRQTSDDDDAVWIVPGADDGFGAPLAANPWRTQETLRAARDARTRALIRASRGTAILGVDVKVLCWILGHLLLLGLVLLLDPGARRIFDVGFGLGLTSPSPGNTLTENPAAAAAAAEGSLEDAGSDARSGSSAEHGWLPHERLQLALFLVLQGAAFAFFAATYASDPGWITPESPAADPVLTCGPCAQCGEVPSLRSHHDKHTGQCVAKHDHHCWYLGTSIGEKNHARFLSLLGLQLGLLVWMASRLLPLLLSCPLLWEEAETFSARAVGVWTVLRAPCAGCSSGGAEGADAAAWVWGCTALGWGYPYAILSMCVVCLALWVPVSYLAVLHTYLAATNQTTLELLKGPRLNYLARAYAGLSPAQLLHGRPPRVIDSQGNVSLLAIARAHLSGRLPPRPFDEGVWRNLRVFFLEPKPYKYRYRAAALELAGEPLIPPEEPSRRTPLGARGMV